ncbi:DUF2512 family protein [Filobacillus milosensis]|uniref:DUF2512 family protein n=1 Tax=Filobacillus milosensis TaxID=94137 RepID=A0A4Y8ISZ5_9BACI|nr:YndM family protein [Filobacillus milosensis]TFB24053.1 DUF2512 family protein [Filobacillus milosensis]
MNHFKLILTKFVACFVLLYLILGFGYDVAFNNVLLISIALTLISYIGDAFILPRTNNTIATATDFVLAFVVIYFMLDMLTYGGDLLTASLISSAGLTVFEYFFHKWVKSEYNEMETEERPSVNHRNLQTEFSEDNSLDNINDSDTHDEDKT